MPTPKSAKSKAREVIERKSRVVGWRTTDEEEIERRRLRAAKEEVEIETLEAGEPIFGTFKVRSASGGDYEVEIRSLEERSSSCSCPDWAVNRLGTCKHVEAVLAWLHRQKATATLAVRGGRRVEIFLDPTGEHPEVKISWPKGSSTKSRLRAMLGLFFSSSGAMLGDPPTVLPSLLRRLDAAPAALRRQVRISRQLRVWLEEERRRGARRLTKEAFLADVAAGKRNLDLMRLPLYDYQREGMLHLAFTERALLADEMGLGKTVQAIAACELLRQLRGVERVLVISPASLKAEWEEQITKFTGLPSLVVFGSRATRLHQYRQSSFFYLANYEQILIDGDEIQRLLAPDVIILDEAQRIKNWRAKTADAVKRLKSPYAFVLTGTPLENRIDDVYSIVQFLDSKIFGPLFRFNRDFHELDPRGRPMGYKNLDEMHRRLRPIMLRRLKSEVEDQLPERTLSTRFVGMSKEQKARYADYQQRVVKLLDIASSRPLTQEEFDQLQRWLACMRMLCDTPYILDPKCRDCPKLEELEDVLGQFLGEQGCKILIFSEWERMLELVRELATEMGFSCAWHTGSVPQPQRRREIRRFKDDPSCRLFLSTDSGSVGLNLQSASVVINLDQPWNPSKLEQRIARAWRKHQKNAVQVVNLVSEGTIEQRMLQVLAGKKLLAEGVLDGRDGLRQMPMPSGAAAFVERLEEILGTRMKPAETAKPPDTTPAERLRQDFVAQLGERLLDLEVCPAADGQGTVLAVVEPGLATEAVRSQLATQVGACFGDAPPRLELIDPTTWAAVQKLVEAGVLHFAGDGPRVLHRSPRLGAPQPDERPRRLELARKAFTAGERKLRMAVVLAGGGFLTEALPPLAEAAEHALRALARLAGTEVAEEEVSPTAVVEAQITRSASQLAPIAGRVIPLVAHLRDLAGNFASTSEEDARVWIEMGSGLFEEIDQALHRAGLGAL